MEDLFQEELEHSHEPALHLDVASMNKNGEVNKFSHELKWSDVLKECSLCGQEVNLMELKNHHRNVHNFQDFEINCPFCSNKFKKTQALLNHLIKKHPRAENLKFW